MVKKLELGLFVTITILYHVWFAYAIYLHVHNEWAFLWCDGLGFVIISTCFTYFCLIVSYIVKHLLPRSFKDSVKRGLSSFFKNVLGLWWVRLIIYVAFVAGVVTFVVVDSNQEPLQLISLGGVFFLILIGVVFSKHPKHIDWRIVFGGLATQFLFAFMILRWNLGRDIVACLAYKVELFMAYTGNGAAYMYDYLVTRRMFQLELLKNGTHAYEFASTINEARALPVPLAFGAFSVVCFFTFFLNILFYYGWIQKICEWTAVVFNVMVGTSEAESANAAANIFLGQAMSPLVIRHYLPHVTISEAHTMVASGFASIAGVTMAIFISYGVEANALLAASVMSAPAGLSYSKLLWPEVDEPKKLGNDEKNETRDHFPNFFTAALEAAHESAHTIVNVGAGIIAMIALVAFLNAMFGYFAGLIGLELSFELVLGWMFMPLAFMMGIPWAQCEAAGYLLALKCVLNEFIAYRQLGNYIQAGDENPLSPRSVMIVTYAMCGSANPGFMGLSLGIFRYTLARTNS